MGGMQKYELPRLILPSYDGGEFQWYLEEAVFEWKNRIRDTIYFHRLDDATFQIERSNLYLDRTMESQSWAEALTQSNIKFDQCEHHEPLSLAF